MAQQKAVEMPIEDDDVVDELAPGTKLLKGQYTITRYLNSGGFGITYLAKDSLDRDVVIKECFPSAFSRRSKTMVAARSRAHTAELRSVVQLFVKEARNLSKIVHPNIVAVHQVFEDNGTAYMALDFVDGLDLQQIIDGEGVKPTKEEIVVIVEKLLHAIGFIHANDMLHRDISPDNVLIAKSGEPVLIDFGAAREQASKSNRAMSALRVVKDGYSPQEFYIAGSDQGPWSDLYALGATFYHLIAGEAPVNGQARLGALAEDRPDPYTKLEGRFEGYPPGFLAAIDKALSTMPKQRVQSAAEWLAMFSRNATVSATAGRVVKSKEPSGDVVHDLMQSERAAGGASFGAPPQLARSQTSGSGSATGSGPEAAPKSGVGTVQVLAGIAATLALVGVGLLMMERDQPQPAAEDAPAAATAAPAPVATAETNAPEAEAEAATETAAAPTATPEPAPDAPAATDTGTAAAPSAETAVAAAPEVAPQETAPQETAPAESAAAEPVTPEAAPAETSPVEPAPVATASVEPAQPEAAPVEEPVAASEPVAEPEVAAAPAFPAPEGVLRQNQIGFAVWDIKLPFVEDNRIIGGQRTAIVQGILPGVDIAEAGTWLAPGLLIYSVNGTDVQLSGSVATAVLNSMRVDPDGMARVVVEYAGSSLEREAGLMTVPTTRLVSLGNGVNVEIRTVDGRWQTVVTGITAPEKTSLRQGDLLYRDKTTGTALDTPQALETILASLVEQGITVTTFSILRGNRIEEAAMQLATD